MGADMQEEDAIGVAVEDGGGGPSLRERIRQASDIGEELVDVPEWDIPPVLVRSMTVGERSLMLRKYVDSETGRLDFDALYSELLIRTCFDPATGERVFEEDDASWLVEKNSGVVERLAGVASRLSGLDQKARDEAGKGSSSTPRTATPSS